MKTSEIDLSLHSSCEHNQHNVKVEYTISKSKLKVSFTIETLDKKWNISPDFPLETIQNWNLWEYDVAEIFFQFRQSESDITTPYWEVQLSPLAQKFALFIKRPREEYNYPENFNFEGSCLLTSNNWIASFEIDISQIALCESPRLYGNFFCCLGPKEKREYWAANINKESKPDFHRPELFLNLM